MNEMVLAGRRAKRMYPSAPHFQGAYVKGASARLHRRPIDACPYKRKKGGGWTAWRTAWAAGWHSVAEAVAMDDEY